MYGKVKYDRAILDVEEFIASVYGRVFKTEVVIVYVFGFSVKVFEFVLLNFVVASEWFFCSVID